MGIRRSSHRRHETVVRGAIEGIDRLVANVEHGRFERTLSGLTAAGALVTAAEIWMEHDRASFGNKMMWLPVALGPVGAAAGVPGVFSRRMAKTALPVAPAAIVANGLQGTYLHVRGIAQRPGRVAAGPVQRHGQVELASACYQQLRAVYAGAGPADRTPGRGPRRYHRLSQLPDPRSRPARPHPAVLARPSADLLRPP